MSIEHERRWFLGVPAVMGISLSFRQLRSVVIKGGAIAAVGVGIGSEEEVADGNKLLPQFLDMVLTWFLFCCAEDAAK